MRWKQEIAIDFASPFQNAIGAMRHMLVSTDQACLYRLARSGKFAETKDGQGNRVLKEVQRTTRNSKDYKNGPSNRTDRSYKFKDFWRNRFLNHVECRVRDHWGHGKIRQLIRTINERLRTDKKIVVSNDKSGISEIKFALRMNPSAKRKSPYECYTGQEPNTIKRLETKRKQFFPELPEVELAGDDFESGFDNHGPRKNARVKFGRRIREAKRGPSRAQ